MRVATTADARMGRAAWVLLARIALTLGLLMAWQIAAFWAGPLYVPPPEAVVERLAEGVRSGVVVRSTVATVRLAATGLFAGFATGVCAVLLLAAAPRALAMTEWYVVASSAVPKYALVPLLILWLGIGDAPKLTLIALLVFYPVFVSGLAGVRAVDRRLVVVVRVLGASRLAAVRHVVWYSTLPFVLSGLKVALPRAVSGAIVGELLIGEEGIGFLIESARHSFDTAGLFVGIALAMALAAVATCGLAPLERRLMPWHPDPGHPGCQVRPHAGQGSLEFATVRPRTSHTGV